jgi:hypothetical protein
VYKTEPGQISSLDHQYELSRAFFNCNLWSAFTFPSCLLPNAIDFSPPMSSTISDTFFLVKKLYRKLAKAELENKKVNEAEEEDFELLTASEMAMISLLNKEKDVVWDQTFEDDTALGSFEVWSVKLS